MENLHIVFWLFKDLSWCMNFRILGMIMVIPTLSIAIFIARRTRKLRAELAHNLAIIFWITANSYWMVAEFYGFDEKTIWNGIEGRHMAMIPFIIGVLILAYYYILIRPKEIREHEVVTM
jgi:hypothetical protein